MEHDSQNEAKELGDLKKWEKERKKEHKLKISKSIYTKGKFQLL